MDVGAWSGDGDQGVLIQPEGIRGNLQTEQVAELRQRKPLTGQRREAANGLRSREVKVWPRSKAAQRLRMIRVTQVTTRLRVSGVGVDGDQTRKPP
jgi:hypothetical protein